MLTADPEPFWFWEPDADISLGVSPPNHRNRLRVGWEHALGPAQVGQAETEASNRAATRSGMDHMGL